MNIIAPYMDDGPASLSFHQAALKLNISAPLSNVPHNTLAPPSNMPSSSCPTIARIQDRDAPVKQNAQLLGDYTTSAFVSEYSTNYISAALHLATLSTYGVPAAMNHVLCNNQPSNPRYTSTRYDSTYQAPGTSFLSLESIHGSWLGTVYIHMFTLHTPNE